MHDASVRMTSHLNALTYGQLSIEVAAYAITAPDTAHHVLDPDQVLGLDPWHAVDLSVALTALVQAEREGWLLSLPTPGSLHALRGPRGLNEAAVERGEAVVGLSGSVGLVPYEVGPAVQWRIFAAEPPFPPTGHYEAERELSQTVLTAAAALTALDVPGGPGRTGHPGVAARAEDPAVQLAPGYPRRSYVAADRAARLLAACELALADDGGAISSFEADARRAQLTGVRAAARAALCAAVSWTPRA